MPPPPGVLMLPVGVIARKEERGDEEMEDASGDLLPL